MSKTDTTDPICTDCEGTGITKQTERRCTCQPQTTKPRERIQITITYSNDDDAAKCEHLGHTVSWEHVPNQSKVCDRAKEMVALLYKQVRG